MKKHDITKLCADGLRVCDRSIGRGDLSSSHAHELVAACFGYKSRAALLADTEYPVSNLNDADIIVLPPDNDAANATLKKRLTDISAEKLVSLDEYDIGGVVCKLLGESAPVYSAGLESIACDVARERVRERFGKFGIDPDQLNLIIEVVDSYAKVSEISFTISINYVSDQGKNTQRDSTMIVTFPRIAGHVGYKDPHVQETQYSGEFRKVLPQWPYPAGTLVMRRDTREIGIVLKAEVGGVYEGSVTICTDTSLEVLLVKGEVFPIEDQFIDFIPLRLFMPYGKWVCPDGSEVLYNRDYRPLWKRETDGTVTSIDSTLYIDHDRGKTEGYFNTKNTPLWNNADKIREIGLPILKAWGVENKRPQILDLLPAAIKSGSAKILRQMY